MRFPEIPTNYIRLPDRWGGTDADADLRHAATYLVELGVALDAFEEDTVSLAAAKLRTRHEPPDWDAFTQEEYFKRRIRLHARAFVYSLFQIRAALEQLAGICPLEEASKAFANIEAAFPTLNDIRNSLAHASERARREPKLYRKIEDTYERLGIYGYWDEDQFFVTPRAKGVRPHSISISEASFAATVEIVRDVCAAFDNRSKWRDWPA